MATRFPSVLARGNGPVALRAGAELNYDATAQTFSITVPPYTHVEDINVFVATTFNPAAPTMSVGDASSSVSWLAAADITWSVVGDNKALDSAQSYSKGFLYQSAATLTFHWTPQASGTAGKAYIFVSYHFLPDMSTGAMITAIQ